MPASGTGVDGVGLRGFSLRGCGVVAPLPPAPGGIVGAITSGTTVFGAPSALPLVLAPTGFTRLMNHEGEPAVARAATRAGVPYALSTMGTTSIEELARRAPRGRSDRARARAG